MKNIELRNNIILELLNNRKIRVKEKIDYDKFCTLYKDYSYLPEWYFAEIIGIKYGLFHDLKLNVSKAIVLKDFNYEIIKNKNEILSEIENLGVIKNNSINAEDFNHILIIYPYLNKEDLLDILGIRITTYKKCNSVINIRKDFILTREEKQIVDSLIKKGTLIPGENINIEKFEYLSNLYPSISKLRFAYMLEITKGPYFSMKKGKTPTILKSRVKEYVTNKKDEIIKYIIENRSAEYEEKIDYNRFLDLYKGYEHIKAVDFASILGINYNNYMSMKSGRSEATILKKIEVISDEESSRIYNEIKIKHNLSDYDYIDYESFKNICKEYPCFSKGLIAIIIGIKSCNIDNIRYKNFRICSGVKQEKLFHIRKYINENRFYTSDELINIINIFGGGIPIRFNHLFY